MLTILSTEYDAERSVLEIYVSGCTRACKGCHNPEAQRFGQGRRWPLWLRDNTLKLKSEPVKHVWILGGDLLCHPTYEVLEFLRALKKVIPHKPLWLWTGEEVYTDIPVEVLNYFDYIKTGSYREDLPPRHLRVVPFPLTLASSNQALHMRVTRSPNVGTE